MCRIRQVSQLSDFESDRIVGLREAELSVREVSRRTCESLHTMLQCERT